jgi:hypothetical protein
MDSFQSEPRYLFVLILEDRASKTGYAPSGEYISRTPQRAGQLSPRTEPAIDGCGPVQFIHAGSGVTIQVHDFDGLVLQNASCGGDGVASPGTGGRLWPIE